MVAPALGPKMQTDGPVDRSDIVTSREIKSLPPALAAFANPLIYNLIGGKSRDAYLTDEIIRGTQNRYTADLITKSKALVQAADLARETPSNVTLAQAYNTTAQELKALSQGNPISDAVHDLTRATTSEARATAKIALEQAAGDTAFRTAESAANTSVIRARASTAKWAGILGTTAVVGFSVHENLSAYQTGLKGGGRAIADTTTDIGLALGGAYVGAQLGTALLPGGGTLVGAVAGGFLGFSINYFGEQARDEILDVIKLY